MLQRVCQCLVAVAIIANVVYTQVVTNQRPIFHVMPAYNWMNDPCGPSYYNGVYHLFMQYNPQSAVWGNMSWYHCYSKDFVHWTQLSTLAMTTNDNYDQAGCWTGSMTMIDGIPTITYTCCTFKGNQWLCKALPADLSDPTLTNWTKPSINPIMNEQPNDYFGITRDPTTAWHDQGGAWTFITGAVEGQSLHNNVGAMVTWKSEDMNFFSWAGVFFENPLFNMIECPDLINFTYTVSTNEDSTTTLISPSSVTSSSPSSSSSFPPPQKTESDFYLHFDAPQPYAGQPGRSHPPYNRPFTPYACSSESTDIASSGERCSGSKSGMGLNAEQRKQRIRDGLGALKQKQQQQQAKEYELSSSSSSSSSSSETDFVTVSSSENKNENKQIKQVNATTMTRTIHVAKFSEGNDHYSMGTVDDLLNILHQNTFGSFRLLDYGQVYASKRFWDPVKDRHVFWGWVAETDGNAASRGWQGTQYIQSKMTLEFDPKTNTPRGILLNPIEEIEQLRYPVPLVNAQNLRLTPGVPLVLDNYAGMYLDIEVTFSNFNWATATDFGVQIRRSQNGTFFTYVQFQFVNDTGVMQNMGVGNVLFYGDVQLDPTGPQERNSRLCREACVLQKDTNDCSSWSLITNTGQCQLFTMYPFFGGQTQTNSGAIRHLHVVVDRTMSGTLPSSDNFPQGGPVSFVDESGSLTMRILADASIIQTFAQHGKARVTSRVYPYDNDAMGLALYSDSPVTASIKVHQMQTIWTD